MPSAVSWSVGLLLGWAALACTPGGVGDPCTPEDEYQQNFNGFQVTETNVESRSFQCETRLCLVNHFQGRVSCRVGQSAAQGQPQIEGADNTAWKPVCSVPGTAVDRTNKASKDNINVEVPAQLQNRQTDQAVYCSCRCDGPDDKARYCECPEGFQCEKLVEQLSIPGGGGQLAGSYCIRAGSKYKPLEHFKGGATCASEPAKCGCDKNAEEYPADCGAKD